jgi:dihydroflavonol-4-reductase
MPPQRTARLVVFGAAGHLGSAALRSAEAMGRPALGIVRSPRIRATLGGTRAELVVVGEADRAPIQPGDVVLDAAAPYPTAIGDARGLEVTRLVEAHLGRVRGWLDAGAAVVHVGSFAAAARRGDAMDTFSRAAHPYFELKDRLADALTRLGALSEPIHVVHPAALLGPWDTKPYSTCLLARIARGDVGALPDVLLDVLDVRDLADALVGDLDGWACARGAPTVIGGHRVALRPLAEHVARARGVRDPAFVPSGAAVAAATALELADRARGEPAGTEALGAMLLHALDGFARTVPARSLARRAIEDTISDALAWYASLGYL